MPRVRTACMPRVRTVLLLLSLHAGSCARYAVGRRAFVGVSFSSALSTVVLRPVHAVIVQNAPPAWVPAGDPGDPASYFEQLRAGRSEMQRCLDNWVALTHADRDTDFDGDAVRRIIGTVGTGSPLLRIDKVFDRCGCPLLLNHSLRSLIALIAVAMRPWPITLVLHY
ncbi:hypothetical protein T492DRAFT_1017547 [Pavlovales sp. CCMP2436]|nr:hypothetical protein T492DRAFT_1017547 [Pavlovales sp. CCMP2436]|mmetsp:Transcript_44954/g.105225  ORF Transcript_44954/g.105225 Transcript_44954/m.105225 type:complete len:168 (-) Transcript_44954:83-586(-)